MKKEFKIGIFALILLLIFGYFVIKTDSLTVLMSKNRSYPIYAKFSTVSGLFPNAPVRLAGVRVGIVEDISLDKNRALVKILMIKKYTLDTNARATISTMGIMGENFIEIIYKSEFETPNPKPLAPGDELLTIRGTGLQTIGDELKTLTPKLNKVLDSVNEIISSGNTRNSLKATLENLQVITQNLRRISEENGPAGNTFKKIDTTAIKLQKTLNSIDNFFANLDHSMYKNKDGLVRNLEASANRMKDITADLKKIAQQLQQGKGTAGKLLNDGTLYDKMEQSIDSVNSLLKEIEKKKESPNKTKLNCFAGIDYATNLKKMRFSFGADLVFSRFKLFSRVRENPVEENALFTIMAGKQYKYISIAAGMVDSGLGGAFHLHLPNRKINLRVEASRFHRDENPLLKTNLYFSLSRDINLSAGYEDLLEKENRKFLVGVYYTY
ncbi:MAG: MCE family protein [bacterium]|nr:MCE family protein [bacterium]